MNKLCCWNVKTLALSSQLFISCLLLSGYSLLLSVFIRSNLSDYSVAEKCIIVPLESSECLRDVFEEFPKSQVSSHHFDFCVNYRLFRIGSPPTTRKGLPCSRTGCWSPEWSLVVLRRQVCSRTRSEHCLGPGKLLTSASVLANYRLIRSDQQSDFSRCTTLSLQNTRKVGENTKRQRRWRRITQQNRLLNLVEIVVSVSLLRPFVGDFLHIPGIPGLRGLSGQKSVNSYAIQARLCVSEGVISTKLRAKSNKQRRLLNYSQVSDG